MNRVLLLSVILLLFAVQAGRGQVPETMSYQGVLTDGSGNVVPDGDYDLIFQLYEEAVGGMSSWTETQADVPVKRGVFSVTLGNTYPLSLPFDRQYWLGVTVEGGSELAPRVQLTAVPYSLSTRFATYTPLFLTVDGQPSPGIAFKTGSGNSSIAVATSTKCNIAVYAYAESAGPSWMWTKLLQNGSEVAKDRHLASSDFERPSNVLIYARTLLPSDGTITYSHVAHSGHGRIAQSRFLIHAVPVP